MSTKVILTCALNGVLTNPKTHAVPVTPEEMAEAAAEAHRAGASIVHIHIRDQRPDHGHLATWDPQVAAEIVTAIRERVPGLIINCTTGVLGSDISGPLGVLAAVKPEMAAMNSGSLNYLKVRNNGQWAWPPMLFDNPVEKVQKFLEFMNAHQIIPEFECFDTGILRSVAMYRAAGMYAAAPFVSLVMGVASGMPAKSSWLPLLKEEMASDAHWQVIAIGRQEVWPLLREAVRLGGHVRTGLEDTFYLPNGQKTQSNGELVAALAALVKSEGRQIATLAEARAQLLL